MNRSHPADMPQDEFAPESSLLTIQVRRPGTAAGHEAGSLHTAWSEAFNPTTGISDEDMLRAALGRIWMESFILERPADATAFTIRPIGRLPRDIQALLADGEHLPALMEQINHMAMVSCHSIKMARTIVELDDEHDVACITLTLLPLACREGAVYRYLGTLGQ